ncbi:MAG: hypothetical protein CVU60_08015 [Deltaproteobacteria bacterium HGW-Deltaproteobacteria-18]|nr:MAG: hypothetical protein CVU60_08015 [Deltaproteobacteria bacterium HGW-Deltaproteobacteria-18]
MKYSTFLDNLKWKIFIIGDIVDIPANHVEIITKALNKESFYELSKFEGMYGIIAVNNTKNDVFVVTDRRSQYSIYWGIVSDKLYVGSEMSSFCKLDAFDINEKWIWELLYYNFPVSNVSVLKGVTRASAGTVMKFSLHGPIEHKTFEYAPEFKVHTPLLKKKKALETALDVFSERFPLYYEGKEMACPITAGWDARTVLAFKPDGAPLTTYTYGIPGTSDLLRAAKVARRAGTLHKEVLFDQEFVSGLPQLMLDTVYVSSGTQGVKRATLLHVYRLITQNGTKYPLTLSGVALGALRGHAGWHPLTSPDVYNLFEGKSSKFQSGAWRDIFEGNLEYFSDHIEETNCFLENKFGSFTSSAHHFLYSLYMIGARYFGGEMKIADNFTTWRVPAYDTKIIEYGFASELSMLNYSQFLPEHTRGSRREMVMQSYLLTKKAPHLAKIPIVSARPEFVLAGGFFHFLYRAYHKVCNAWNKEMNHVPLEDWEQWLNKDCKTWIDAFFKTSELQISKYVSEKKLMKLLDEDKSGHIFSKIFTIEIILKLVKNRWVKFW